MKEAVTHVEGRGQQQGLDISLIIALKYTPLITTRANVRLNLGLKCPGGITSCQGLNHVAIAHLEGVWRVELVELSALEEEGYLGVLPQSKPPANLLEEQPQRRAFGNPYNLQDEAQRAVLYTRTQASLRAQHHPAVLSSNLTPDGQCHH
jgi:hypothetical protein